MLRGIEGTIEVAFLSLAYYASFRFMYDRSLFYAYLGYGKYVLILVYALLIIVLFSLNRAFVFGRLKLSHIFISQVIDVLIADVFTYFQLSLMANKMISFLPTIYLFLIDIFICLFFSYIYTALYHSINKPRKSLLIYGSENAQFLAHYINKESQRLNVTETVSTDKGLDKVLETIPEYDAVIINDVENEFRNDVLKFC